MRTAKNGDSVQVHYRGTLEDGSEFDSSAGGDPIRFTIGSGEVIPGFEQAIVGMAVGEKKQQRIPAHDAYGEPQDDLIFEVGRDALPSDAEVKEGDVLEMTFPDGQVAPVRISGLSESTITLDANHPLTGETLIFELELVAID